MSEEDKVKSAEGRDAVAPARINRFFGPIGADNDGVVHTDKEDGADPECDGASR